MSGQTLIVGCGALGIELAHLLKSVDESPVAALTRTGSAAEKIRRLGGHSLALDLDQHPAPLFAYARIFWLAPPPASGTTDPRLQRSLQALHETGASTRLVYVSTSGVYGDCQGRWIDESEPCTPKSDRGKRRLHAEEALDDFAQGHSGSLEHMILRVPGIYGPSKLPADRLRKGLPVVRALESPYTNRIHIADLARVAVAAMNRGRPGARYNVSDGNPTTMADYFMRCARHLGLKAPETISREAATLALTPAMLSFLDESKRLINKKMIEELGVRPLYPNLEAGLRACLERSLRS